MLWLVWRQVSLAHALLVLYTFSINDLDDYTFEEIISIVEYVSHNQNSLCCEALNAEAMRLTPGSWLGITPPLLHFEERPNAHKFLENATGRSSSPSADPQAQFATKKRKQASSLTPSDGLNNDYSPERALTDKSSASPVPTSHTVMTSPASLELLGLFAALGGVKVPSLIFERFLSPQLRWSEDGDTVHAPLHLNSGMPHGNLFSPDFLTRSLKELCSSSWVYMDDYENPSYQSFSVSESAREYSAQLLKVKGTHYWTMLALQFVCHVFPRDSTLEASFHRHGKILSPVIDHLVKESKAYELPRTTRIALAEVFVAKARLGSSQYNRQALNEAIEILGDDIPDFIQASIALRRSILARLDGAYHSSEQVIGDYQKRAPLYGLANPRLRALSRLLIISHLENLIQLEDYEKAEYEICELNKWEPSEEKPWSPMELSVNFKKWSTISKIYQSRGRLESARSYLASCYTFLRPEYLQDNLKFPDPNRFQIISRLSDLLCAEGYWVDARSKIEFEIESILNKTQGKFAKALKRLKVSLLDVDIAESKYDQASSGVEWLKQQFHEISSPDISDQWLHVRSTIASARLLHYQCRFQDTIFEWEQVLSLVQKYSNSFKSEGFFYGLAQLSISLARIQTARSTIDASCIVSQSWRADTRQYFDKGCAALVREDTNYWIPTLPRTVIPDLLSKIQSEKPTWGTEDEFLKLQQKYPYLPVSEKRQQGLSSRI
ncbi:hypothetical protein PENANT_c216G03004 [Penicillium antarcticum]|uniref:Uncharacterized protein n=1 Tax=Penicillium antarcticum TaxID=416450 RepID=A0A1V6P8K5_9EURO|nr:hypothetical protein PENANT_c216G03004 [Penicillium antarcticum]